ncbi:MAG: transposase, partial [Planctomycetia bacterium]|nr:transposase [Planctomycetia bacterium]
QRSRMLMDKAYEGDRTRKPARTQRFVPVVPPKTNRQKSWRFDKKLYKRRNEVERFFRRLKGFRRIFTRYDKLTIMSCSFLQLAMIYELLRNVV